MTSWSFTGMMPSGRPTLSCTNYNFIVLIDDVHACHKVKPIDQAMFRNNLCIYHLSTGLSRRIPAFSASAVNCAFQHHVAGTRV